MKEERDCNIVQDLLPNYIDKLTKEETNKFIMQHLEECNECREILSNMEKDLVVNSQKEQKKVKYIKKYNKKLKKLKIILLIFLLLIVIFLGITISKMIIIKNLNDKVSRYVNMDNRYEKIINDSKETITITEYYTKGESAILFLNTTIKSTGEVRKLTNYYKGEKTNTYIQADGNKIALLDTNGLPSKVMILTLDYGDSIWNLFQMAIATTIRSGEYNGKECYILSIGNNSESYIEKATGLRVKAKDGISVDQNENKSPIIAEYYYEFGNVKDDIFVEPNIDEYQVKK